MRCKRTAVAGTDPLVCAAHSSGQVVLDDEVAQRFVQLVRAGNYLETAATSCGLTLRTVQRWLAQGRDPGAPEALQALSRAVERASADAEARNVAIVATAAKKNWQAAAWLLERQHPERWTRPTAREKAQGKTSTAPKSSDPLGEVDELAARRRVG